MYPYDVLEIGAVTLFRDSYCSGDSARFEANATVGSKVSYTKSDMDSHGIANDKVTSLYVPFAHSVDLYKDDNFSGDLLTITGAIFEDTNFTMKCIELDSDWNDELSSLRVYKNRQIGEAKGFWSQITN